jgi:hypothetical protein
MIEACANELSKGAPDMPAALVRKLVKARIAENEARRKKSK